MKKVKRAACLAFVSVFLCTSMVTEHVNAMGAAGGIASGDGIPYCSDSGAFSLLLQVLGVEYDSSNASERMGLDKDFSEYTREEIDEMFSNGTLEFVSPEELFWDDANKLMAKFLEFVQEKIEVNGAQFKTNMEAVKGWLHDVACGTLDKASDAFKLLKMFVLGMKENADNSRTHIDSNGYPYFLNGESIKLYDGYGQTSNYANAELKISASSPVYIAIEGSAASIYNSYLIVISSSPFDCNFIFHKEVISGNGDERIADISHHLLNNYGISTYALQIPLVSLHLEYGFCESYSSIGSTIPKAKDFYDKVFGNGDIAYETRDVIYPFIITPPLDNVIGRDNSLDNVDVVGVGSKAGATDIPLNLDDLMERVGSIEGMVTALKEGLLTGDDVRDIVGVLPVDLVDKTTIAEDEDKVIPITDIPSAPTVDTTPAEGYTLSLKSLFPFCLPFDLIDFINVLSAPAEAPHFKWPIKYKAGSQWKEYTVDIDLSKFDTVASLLRDMECLAFIVGLIMVTRSHMIRG